MSDAAQHPSTSYLLAHPSRRPMVVVVTGLSGAGRTTALHALEDLGFFCIDNLPTVLAPQAVALCEAGGMTRVALGMDVRVRVFLGEVGNVLSQLEEPGASEDGVPATRRDLSVLFLDASDETILRRFSESRRPHALATSESLQHSASVLEGVTLERERLAPLRARATRVIDTTSLSVHDLRRAVVGHFGPASGNTGRMTVRVVSFGFKYGTPVDADLVLDVRFLKNPYFVPELKRLPGTERAVRDYVMALPETAEFLKRTLDLLRYVLPKYEREGKSYLTIAVGCTGGMHRSVVLAEQIATALDLSLAVPGSDRGAASIPPPPPVPPPHPTEQPRIEIVVAHRDVERRDPAVAVGPPSEPSPGKSPRQHAGAIERPKERSGP